MPTYPEFEAVFLLRAARLTLERITTTSLRGQELFRAVLADLNPDGAELSPLLTDIRACFITLEDHATSDLRGCTGTLLARSPLIEEVIHTTTQTAFFDPRFPAVTAEELPYLRVEISILTPPTPLTYIDPADLIRQLRPHIDGVTLMDSGRRATYLPQVWEKLPDPAEFLDSLCRKMGVTADTWQRKPLYVETYQAIKLVESA